MKKVVINGLGRIGRLLLRQYCENRPKGVKIVAANDLVAPENLAYLLRFDSVHGRTPYPVTTDGNEIHMKEHRMKVYHLITHRGHRERQHLDQLTIPLHSNQ